MSVEWRYYAGRRYLHVDYAGCRTEEDTVAVYEEQARMMHAAAVKTRVFSDLSGAVIGSAFVSRVNEGGKQHGGELLERTAMVGVSGLKRVLADGYRTLTGLGDKVRVFDDDDEALRWLME